MTNPEHGPARARLVGRTLSQAPGDCVSNDQEEQRRITRLALEAADEKSGFAPAG